LGTCAQMGKIYSNLIMIIANFYCAKF
jgi:hypothetical protein